MIPKYSESSVSDYDKLLNQFGYCYVLNHILNIDSVDKLQRTCDNIIADFDAEILSDVRKEIAEDTSSTKNQ